MLEREGLVERTKTDTGPYLQKALRDAFGNHPLVGEIQGVARSARSSSRRTRRRASASNEADLTCSRTVGFELGAIVRSTNGRLIVAPPLVIDHAQIDELVDTMRKAVDATAREVLGIDC